MLVETGCPQVVDPLDFLCEDDGICPSIAADGDPIYRGSAHLWPKYVRSEVTFPNRLLLMISRYKNSLEWKAG